MSKKIRLLPLILSARILCAHADGDFVTALKDYEAKAYSKAHDEFLALAELGDSRAQHNLAAMALLGEGMAQDKAAAVGWLTAAQDNGYGEIKALDKLKAGLTPIELEKTNEIASRYGHQQLLATVLPDRDIVTICDGSSPTLMYRGYVPTPVYPIQARRAGVDGDVLIEFTVGQNGMARDPEILNAAPAGLFETESLDSLFRARFMPALIDGQPAEDRRPFKFYFRIDGGGSLWNMPTLKKIKAAADQGVPTAEYLIALSALSDDDLGVKKEDISRMMVEAAQGGEPRAQYWLARALQCRSDPKSRFWLERAAAAGHATAGMKLALELLSENGTPADRDRGIGLLHRAADSKDPYVLRHIIAILAASPLTAARDPALAKKLLPFLKEAPTTPDPQVDEVMAAAYAINADFAAATKLQSSALSKARHLQWDTAFMEERLAFYQNGRQWLGDLFAVPVSAAPNIEFRPITCSNEEDEAKRGSLPKCAPPQARKDRKL